MTVGGYTQVIGGAAVSRSIWTWARLVGGAAILAVLVWRVGAGPFVDGLRLTTAWALAVAVAITSLSTLCCAWRWSLVAGGLGVERRSEHTPQRSEWPPASGDSNGAFPALQPIDDRSGRSLRLNSLEEELGCRREQRE